MVCTCLLVRVAAILLTICISTFLVILLGSVQWIRKSTCNAFECIRLIYSLYLCPGFCAYMSVCIKLSGLYICTHMSYDLSQCCPAAPAACCMMAVRRRSGQGSSSCLVV